MCLLVCICGCDQAWYVFGWFLSKKYQAMSGVMYNIYSVVLVWLGMFLGGFIQKSTKLYFHHFTIPSFASLHIGAGWLGMGALNVIACFF